MLIMSISTHRRKDCPSSRTSMHHPSIPSTPTRTTTSALAEPWPAFATIPHFLFGRSFLELGAAEMKPLARAVVVVARDHLAIRAAVAIAVFLLVGVVRIMFGVVVVLFAVGFQHRNVFVFVFGGSSGRCCSHTRRSAGPLLSRFRLR